MNTLSCESMSSQLEATVILQWVVKRAQLSSHTRKAEQTLAEATVILQWVVKRVQLSSHTRKAEQTLAGLEMWLDNCF